MLITCVTCRYLPNLRYIAMLCAVDRAVVLDLAPLPNRNKNSFVSRNRIRDRSEKRLWLSVPIRRKGIRYISDARIDNTNLNWIDKHIRTLAHAYPNHDKVAGNFLTRLENELRSSDGRLIDLNSRTLHLILEFLGINNASVVMQSSFLGLHSKEHRLELAQSLDATAYLAGQVEWTVMRESGCIERMDTSGIKVVRSAELDPLIFPIDEIRHLSCVHTICTLGPGRARELVDKMMSSLGR